MNDNYWGFGQELKHDYREVRSEPWHDRPLSPDQKQEKEKQYFVVNQINRKARAMMLLSEMASRLDDLKIEIPVDLASFDSLLSQFADHQNLSQMGRDDMYHYVKHYGVKGMKWRKTAARNIANAPGVITTVDGKTTRNASGGNMIDINTPEGEAAMAKAMDRARAEYRKNNPTIGDRVVNALSGVAKMGGKLGSAVMKFMSKKKR